jgi:GxxExxY protein
LGSLILNRRGAENAEEGKMRDVDDRINELTEAVIGAAIEVHRQLGPGFVEAAYHRALAIDLAMREVAFESEQPIRFLYKGRAIGEGRIDLLIHERVVVELKAVDILAPIHQAQVISYLKAIGHHVGLLINFSVELLRDGIKRVILSSLCLPPRTPRLRG